MGQRVNFNGNNKKKINAKLSFLIIVSIIMIYAIVHIFIKAYKNVENKNLDITQKYNVSDYNSLEELLYQYSCTYLREIQEDGRIKIHVVFDRNLYTNDVSNESHFMKIVRVVAEFKKFADIELIDTSRNIDILIDCDGEYINSVSINGDLNYYLNKESEINSNKIKAVVVPFTIQSAELKELINNNWNDSINFGTKDSTCDGYNIYFDEGIKYKKVAGKIFNVIFTNKYDSEVAGYLKPGATSQEIKDSLGNPSFEKTGEMLGYLGEDNYLFFDLLNNQISIYPVQDLYEEEEFKNLIDEMNKTNDVKTFVDELTDLWIDYDEYNYNENYVELQYSLLGVKLAISSYSLKNGIYLYQNYKGDIDFSNVENVYIEDTDLISDIEYMRIISYNLLRTDIWYEDEESGNYISQKFTLGSREELGANEYGIKGPIFVSRNSENADSELERTLLISSHIWYDDAIIVYSVDNDGIYVYNCETRNNVKVAEIDGTIQLNSVNDTTITYNENKIINL